jgi:uncharacterized protein (DUF2267 family)
MHRDDLVSQVRARARLHGRNEARQVIQAVLQAFRRLVPDTTFQQIVGQLPRELNALCVGRDRGQGPASDTDDACRSLVRAIAQQLHVDEPNAAFYSRIVFEQLNTSCRGITPASLAQSLPAEVRPLIAACAEDPAWRYRDRFPVLGSSAALPSLRAQAAVSSSIDTADCAAIARAEPGITASAPGLRHVIREPVGPAADHTPATG